MPGENGIRFDTTIDTEGLKRGFQDIRRTAESETRQVTKKMEAVDQSMEEAEKASKELNQAIRFKPEGMEKLEAQLDSIDIQKNLNFEPFFQNARSESMMRK